MRAAVLLSCFLLLPLSPLTALGQSISDSYVVMSAGAGRLLSSPGYPDFNPKDRTWILYAVQGMPQHLPWRYRHDVASAVLYESSRAGLDPVLVLAVIQRESDFQKYCISSAGACGLMQIMPFWQRLIGHPDHNLFDVRHNIRFGCLVLRHYIDLEKGDISRALARYNGSIGRQQYPDAVLAAFRAWQNKFP